MSTWYWRMDPAREFHVAGIGLLRGLVCDGLLDTAVADGSRGNFRADLAGRLFPRSPLERILPDAAAGFFGLIYVALPLIFAPLLTVQENGTSLLLFLLVVVWAGDIAALYVGRSIGRHPMAPQLSPKKTWEGAMDPSWAASRSGSESSISEAISIATASNCCSMLNHGGIGPAWQFC